MQTFSSTHPCSLLGQRVLSIYVLIIALILAVFVPATWATTSNTMPVIIDTDSALDDWLAILYLLRHPRVDVRAITIVGTGETHCQPGIRNIGRLLRLTGQTDIPIACGREKTSAQGHVFPDFIRHDADTMMGLHLANNAKANLSPNALTLLQQVLTNSQQPVTILAIGPHTNLAELLQHAPNLKKKIKQIVIMGGALDVAGNIIEVNPDEANLDAEWNFYIDPQATDTVFNSHIPIILVPLDITNQIPIDDAFLRALKRHHPGKTGLFVQQAISKTGQSWYFWDPLAAIILSHMDSTSFKQETLKILLQPKEKVAKLIRHKQGTPVLIPVNLKKDTVVEEFLRTVI